MDERPPRAIRILLYRYEMAGPFESGHWRRTLLGEWMRPATANDDELLDLLANYGWAQ